jgi:3-deoxy-D-manno-octulosonic-acid transferase
MGWLLYRFSMALALAASAPALLLGKGAHYRASLAGRLGRGPTAQEPDLVWIHAVSVGEVGVAATLVRGLPAELPLLVTTVTPTGQQEAQKRLGERARVGYLPLDLAGPLDRFFARVSPRCLVLVEGDYWPLLLARLRQRRTPVAVVNGRVSDRTFARLRRLRRAWPGLLDLYFRPIAGFGVQTPEDARRLGELGVEPERIRVTGNLKFETPAPALAPGLSEQVERAAAGRPLLVAGSTMTGEEEIVLEAFDAAGGGDAALLALAPRHPQRFEDVARRLAERGLAFERRSAPPTAGGRPDVLLLDTLGELAGLYQLARGAFIGGTLVPTGGHNPLEAACYGVPVVVGPAMDNFREMAETFDRAAAWHRARSAAELGAIWREWLADPAAARTLGARGARLVEENRGALERTLTLLRPWLPNPAAAP